MTVDPAPLEWPSALRRHCPVCGVNPGRPCVSTGHHGAALGTPRRRPHDARMPRPSTTQDGGSEPTG